MPTVDENNSSRIQDALLGLYPDMINGEVNVATGEG